MKRSTIYASKGLAMAVALVLALVTATEAGDKKQARTDPAIGEAAPQFELTDVFGNTHKLADYKGKIVVLQFQSIHCPWDKYTETTGYTRVMKTFVPKYGTVLEYADDPAAASDSESTSEKPQVVFLAINSNHNESAEQVRTYAEKVKFPYPILKDPGNRIADAYNAQTTPHFYVIDEDQVLRYMGGFEQVPGSPTDCGNMEEKYLGPVIDAVLADEDVPYTKTTSKGCTIKRQKS